MRRVRGGRVLPRRLVRAAAVVMFFVLGSVWTMGSADASALPQATLRFSSMQAFVKSLFANAVGLPGQVSGTASGKGGDVSAKGTRAGAGSGHAPGTAKGELPAYSPTPKKVAAGKSGTAPKGFDAKTSIRLGGKSTAFTTWYQNADESQTERVSQSPINYRDAAGAWQPIDATLARQADGRWHARANGFGLSFAGGGVVSGAAGAAGDGLGAVRQEAASRATPSQGQLGSLSLGSGESFGWSLSGASAVAPVLSSDGIAASYAGILPDTTLDLTSESYGAKESLVLASASAANSWTFPLQMSGVSLTQGADGMWQLVNASGAVVAVLPPPSASDANVNAHTGVAATTHDVSYALSTVGGVQQLTMTLDPAWLHAPARVFPVTVDPTVFVSIAGQAESTYVSSHFHTTNELYNDQGFMKIGFENVTPQHTIGFVDFPSQVADTGWHITAAQFAAFDQHAWNTSSSYGYSVYPAGGSWSPSGVTWDNQPSYIGSVLGTWNGSPAVSNTTCNSVSGRWEYTPVDANYLTSVAIDRYQYWGLELLTPAETSGNTNVQNDPDYWKVLDSSLVSSCSPYLQLTYTTDVAPQINVGSMSPASGFNSATLTPVLSASGSDADNWPSPLQYQFAVYPGTGGQALKSSGWQSGTTWTVPAGVLKWGQSYQWTVMAYDGDPAQNVGYSTATYNAFTTAVPPPLLTDNLSQDSSGHGFDPALGNYTTSVTDAQVATVGPALSITRDYNSLDPRTSQALGAGWSSILDARAAEQYDTSGNVTSVTVTYPDGSQVGYGKNADGSFAPPLGRFVTFTANSGGGYTLADKNDTVYSFAQPLGSGVFGLSSVVDAAGRTLSFTWSNGEIMTVTSTSGRALHLVWSTPSGAAYAHVSTVTTDPATAGNQSTASVWKYFYTGDELASVCDPVQSGSCTGAASDASTRYSYTTGSQYRSAVLDGAPRAYWPLGEASGTSGVDGVLANQHSLDATYTNVALGSAGGLAGSTATAAVFNGSSSQAAVSASPPVLNTASSFSVSAWVKLNTTSAWGEVVTQDGNQDSGFFLEYDQPDGKWAFTRTSSDSGSAAVTRAESSVAPIAGAWTHLVGVYDANAGTLTLYVNGVASTPVSYSGAWSATGPLVIGRNLWAGTKGGWLNGSVSDVSAYQNALPAATVAGLYHVGTQATPLLTKITRPSGAVAAQIAYSTVTGRATQVTDNNDGTWQVGNPSVSGSAEGYRAATLGAAPSGYWRLGDAAGASTAFNEVAADGQGAFYNNVTLGTAQGPMTSPTAGSFDGSTSYVSLPQSTVPLGNAASVALWFNTSHAPGVLFEYQSKPLGQAGAGSGSTNYVNVYVGTDGKLHGGFFTVNGVPEMASSATVTDGNWHQVVLTATTGSGATQTLYLDGKQVAQLPGANFASIAAGSQIYLGAGTSGVGWPALPDLTDEYFNGDIAEAAFFQSALTGSDVSDLYTAAKDAAGLNPTETVVVTDPNGHPVTYEYDPANGGRMIAQIDATGAKTTYGYDSGGYLHTMVDPDGNETITGHDARGNQVTKTTCQVQSTNTCSTQYYTYWPTDNTTGVLSTPDPRNDMVVTSSDPRSSSSTDPTYQTSYGYDARGDRTSVTTPPVPGYPAGRTASTTYTDGTTTYAASDNTSAAVPAGLPWTQTSAGGAVTQYHYYAAGDLYSTTDPAGLLTCDGYDGLGRLTAKTVIYTSGATCAAPGSSAQVTAYTYDGLGRTATTTAPATTDVVTGAVHTPQTTMTYDPDSDVTKAVVADLTGGDATRTSTLTYNSLDQVQTSTDPAQATTTYTYNALGLKATVQNAVGDVTAYTYDNAGRLTYTTLKNYTGSPSGSQAAADLVQEARTYDPAGRLASVTDAMGYSTLYQYTDNGLTASVTRCSAMTITGGVPTCTGSSFIEQSSTYDGAGNQTKQVTNNGTTETDYTYDDAGRETSTTLDPGGLKRTTTKSYTADDFTASQTTGDANGSATTDYAYTPTGVMTSQSVENYTTGAPTGWWKLNDGAAGATTPSTARDWSGQNNTGALNSGVSWASGAASFNGASSVINTAGPVLNTTASYSISAWVNLASTTQDYQTIVGQSAADGGNVYLEYSPTFGGWSFILRKADNSATGLAAYDYASSTAGVATDTWTHLTAVYNASTGAMQLYVNGAPSATATDTTPWQANGLTNIGATANASFTSNYTDGQIANVQLYPRALSAGDVSTLYTNGRTGAALSASSNTTTWQMDPRGLATSMTDADGNTTSYVYDAAGSKVQTIAPTVMTGSYNTSTGAYTTATVAPVSSTGYDTFGDVAEAKDPDGNTIVNTYDADGRQTAATLPSYTQPGSTNHATIAAAKTVTQYNALGEVDKSRDAAQTETDYSYDQLGHQTSATFDPTGLNRTATSVYDADGDVLKSTDPTGAIQASTYDYLGRQLTATQVLGLGGAGSTQIPTGCQTYNNVATQAACTSSSQYADAAGFLSQTTSPAGVTAGYGYDAAGERTSVTDGANQKTTSAYDYAGRVVKTTAPDGTSTAATYDPAGQQTATGQYDRTGNLLRTATASYDGDGNVLSTTDADANALIAAGKTGYSTTFTYDATGLLQSETQPASYTSTLSQVPSVTQSITTSFGYDAAGQRTQNFSGNGSASYTTYNAWGLPESNIEPNTATYATAANSTTTLVYDIDGRPIEQDAPGGVTTLQTYDTAGETLTQSGTGAEAATATRNFTYYNNGLVKTAATSNTATSGSNATSEAFAYDDSGALTNASGSAGTSAFTYTADGQMATRADTVAGTVHTTGYGYDTAGRLSTINDPLTGVTDTYGYTPNSLNYTITYGTGGDVRSFTYNTAHELTSDALTSGTATVASIGYGYDPNGNEASKTTTGFTGAAANTYTYDQAGRLKSWSNGTTVTGYSYDKDSNRTQVGANVFTYDARDQLTSDGVTSYAYAARGTLQTITSTAHGTVATTADAYGQIQTDGAAAYTYDALGRVTTSGITAFDYSGTGNTLSYDGTTTYARDPSGNLLSDLQPGLSGRVDWTDQHTDVVGYIAPNGSSLTGSVAYDPLGQVLSKTGHQTSLGYQSEYTSPTTGKINMAARWYNPATGQFTSKDTQANNPVPNSANANPFAYANGNPLTGTDPTGHCAHADGDFCADKGANAASQASAGNTTVLTASAKPAVWAAYAHYLVDRAWQAAVKAEQLPRPVTVKPVVKDTPGTVTCSNYMALQTGCTAGQQIQVTTVAPQLDTQGVQAASAGAGMAAGFAAWFACTWLGGGPEDPFGDALCGLAAGGIGGAASQGVNCAAYRGSECSPAAFAESIGGGMATGLAGVLSASVMCKLLCGEITRLAPSLIGDQDPVPTVLKPGDDGFVGPVPRGVPDDESALNNLKQGTEKADRPADPAGTSKPPATPDNTTPTPAPSGGGVGDTTVDTQPATPVVRPVSISDISTIKALPSTWSQPALPASPRAPLGATARIYPLPAEPNGLFDIEDRLAQAENLMYKDALAAGRNTGKDRTWNAGVNTETGDIAVACSGLGTGFCAEPNVVAALGGDSSNVKFTIAIQRQRLFGDGSPWAWLPKPVCELCQAQYRPTQWGSMPPFVPGASWSVQ